MTIYTFDSEKQKDKNIKKLTWFLRNTELYSNWEITKIKVFKQDFRQMNKRLHKKCVW